MRIIGQNPHQREHIRYNTEYPLLSIVLSGNGRSRAIISTPLDNLELFKHGDELFIDYGRLPNQLLIGVKTLGIFGTSSSTIHKSNNCLAMVLNKDYNDVLARYYIYDGEIEYIDGIDYYVFDEFVVPPTQNTSNNK